MVSARVECRSNHDYVGRPLAFTWQDKRLEVIEVLIQIHTPQGYSFRVRSKDLGLYELDYDSNTGEWSVQQL